jgi:hypothetical protein
MPPPPQVALDGGPPAPRALRPVVVLLIANLTLSVLLTIAVLIAHNSVIDYQIAHHHGASVDPQTLRDTYLGSMWGRLAGNVIVSVVYVFLVRALMRGRRWAYRRVIIVGAAGIVALGLIQLTPYPWWMRAEQVVQALVLAGLLYFVLRPGVRGHFAKHLPGRTRRRFR